MHARFRTEVRLFLLPKTNGESTLSHFLALHDAVYCYQVFLPVVRNPIYELCKVEPLEDFAVPANLREVE